MRPNCTNLFDMAYIMRAKLFSVCSSGSYGVNCTQTCGKCRNDETCNTVYGHCSGCMDGYTETDLTCKTRKYAH